ncbi:hypothetical protein DPMN_009857 [Dreissena polymorpha]|uniref:Uncharacterized protein n=1 Tax=Dreissena polymorpha TaxID=45954 RepID=A0A9D4N220_DREPO|nr:hypothetical protein DPMN_009857 [Dreissena polymorpha]
MYSIYSRKASLSSASSNGSPLLSPKLSRGPSSHSTGPTPPTSPGVQNTPWKSRLHTIKNSFLGSPRFHRRKLQGIPYPNHGANGVTAFRDPFLLPGEF